MVTYKDARGRTVSRTSKLSIVRGGASGTGSGYLSLFHTELGTSDGKLTTEQCFQAKNWKVKR